MPGIRTTNFVDSNGVDLGRKLVTKDYLLEVYGTILENSPASGLIVTPELWGWGVGGGRPGDGKRTPVTTFAGGTNWKQVSAGGAHTVAIKTDGTLWTWGYNNRGQLGDNTIITRSTPVTTFAGGNNWKQVFCGNERTLAIKTDGSLWVWGQNNAGLGINNASGDRSTPVTTFAGGTDWKSVASGGSHTVAIKTDGTLWVWGGGSDGKLGTNNTAERSIPVTTFAGGNTWKQVACGYFNTTAIKTDGSLWTWGRNNEAQLGTNGGPNRSTPVTTFAGGNNWKSVSFGNNAENHIAAIKTDGTLWTWGRNSNGQIGVNQGYGTHRSTPVTTFAGGNNWKQVSVGSDFTMAIQTIDYI